MPRINNAKRESQKREQTALPFPFSEYILFNGDYAIGRAAILR